jgi:hypothetical protein
MIFEFIDECSARLPPGTEPHVMSPLGCIVAGGGCGVNPPCG